ncbi:CSP protein [Crotalus adamanteus]|uniref:CSP protein n=1 Tax=Crotalus adamanteus TaxID=8729 RepID=A0AAW1CCW6_CROAD
MLTVLQNVISDCCHLLLFLLVAILFVPATIWAFQKVKKIQADARNKKQSKYRVPWIASLERLSVTSTDPERKKGISSATEQKSCNNLSLYRTLCVLDKKIEYLTWQMQRISKPISRSASNTTLDSITSLYSWAHSSTRDVCYSRSRTPPSPPVPIASQEIPEWQGHVTSPYKTETLAEGSTTITLAEGNTTITLGERSTTIILGERRTTITLAEGSSTITLAEGSTTIILAEENSTITLAERSTTITLAEGSPTIILAEGSPTITLAEGSPTITLAEGSPTITLAILAEGSTTIILAEGSTAITVAERSITILSDAQQRHQCAGWHHPTK